MAIRDVADFPRAGIVFKDISPLLGDADLFARATRSMARPFEGAGITHVVGIESRGVAVHVKLLEGNPADAIIERAEALHALMIVLGTHGRGGFRRFLLGSTAERVVRTATVPVLTVHLPE